MWRGRHKDHAAGVGAAGQDGHTHGEQRKIGRGGGISSNDHHDESQPFLLVEKPTNTDTSPSPLTLHARRRPNKCCLLMMLFVLLFILTVASTGGAFVDQRLPTLPPLPAHPVRVYATLHSDSNACYDMALLVFLASWNNATRTTRARTSSSSTPLTTTASSSTTASNSQQQPMLVLYSTPALPYKVADYIDQHADIMRAVRVPEQVSYVVQNPRWRKCATKFAVWDSSVVGHNVDQVEYYDSDHIFRRTSGTNGGEQVDGGAAVSRHAGLEAAAADPGDANANANAALLYAAPDRKYSSQFNAGRMLLRPDNDIYQKLMYLYNRRFWIMDWTDMIKSGDQRFLNAVFRNHWQRLDISTSTSRTAASTVKGSSAASAVPLQVQHAKVWKLATFPLTNNAQHNATRSMARHWIDTLGLHVELKKCMQWRFAYGNQQTEKGLVEYWF
jgi:hypothetical protein